MRIGRRVGGYCLGLGVSLAAVSLFGQQPPLFEDRVVARGKGFEVRESQVEEKFLAFKANRAAQGEAVPESRRAQIEAEFLERLISTQILLAQATEADREKAQEITEKFLAEMKKQAGSEAVFERQLLANGMTPESFRESVIEQALIKAVIDREVRDHHEVTEEEVRSFYEERSESFEQPERVRVQQVLISSEGQSGNSLEGPGRERKRALAGAVLEKARAGEDFDRLIEEYSEDPNRERTGGEYTFARAADTGKTSIVPAFEGAAFSLEPGQLSEVIETQFGFHIVKLLEKIPAGKTPFEEVRQGIYEALLQQEVEKHLPAYLDRLRQEAAVEILD